MISRKVFLFKLVFCCGFLFLSPYDALFADEFPFIPPKNFTVNPQYIGLHHPISTNQALGQLYFDQGLTFLYAFNHDAAYWSFYRAAEVDSDMAMAYWGMALAMGSNINMEITPERAKLAYETIQKGIEKSENKPENEKEYIHALAQRYNKDPNADSKQLAVRYSDAMQKLSENYPDDPDAAVLYAESLLDVNPWHQWDLNGKPLEGTLKAIKALQSVLRRHPDHLGANHYFIHAVEASRHPEIALISAERLKTLLPSSGHILHMPSHIYLLVGDYLEAARSNLAAIAADQEYIRQYGTAGIYPVHYLSHNWYFLSRAYTLQGRFEDALQAANQLTGVYSHHFKKMQDLEYYASAPLTVLITFHRWKEILEMKPPEKEMQVVTALWHFGRGIAYASLGNISASLNEQQHFLEKKNQIAPKQTFGYNRANQILTIAEYCLQARLAETQGKSDEAIDFLQRAIYIQDSLSYNEPPDWFFPVRETLGGLLIRLQKPIQAESVLRQELKRHPRNGRALFALTETLKAQSRTVDAFWTNQEFQKAWRYSTVPLTQNDF